MTASTEVHALLLAAGNASRFGSAKQLALIGGVPLVRHAALAALATGCPLTVVTGAYADEVLAALAGLPLTILRNDDWQQGMGSSLGCGFRHALAGDSAGTLVCLGDQPRVGEAQLRRVIEAWKETPQCIVTADLGDAMGPPCLFPRAWYAELSNWSGPQGARKLLERHAQEVIRVTMPEAAVDVDTREDYERLIS
ncbi:nucleotidyltransferase family protein [Solimonas sp. K1W22B-7]|uniref:nucleotidyltransferase family protein n=1 Tax=Solimonas sp. K1W22B-7 TaxID=2303331 RepID=UPI000E333D29|nr:nucleotidyltransferase family protein [Solimonas sp. K1W22B-7]AXQ31171.1 nucleotidyltransferase family protein [Solimonas sp. K1W22B-7]